MSKLVRRFMLGDLWDYGKNESWYSYMAAKGLHLQSVGDWLVTFEKGEPKNTKYRIEILEEVPTLEQLDLYKECGWELVTNKKIFYIFSSPEELNAPELQTDHMEQSFTFKMIKKQLKKSTLIINVAVLFMLAFIYIQFFLNSEPYLNIIRRSSITTIMLTIAYIYMLFESVRGYFAVKKIKDSLQNGIPINHEQKWKLSYIFSSIIYTILITMVLTAIYMPIYEVIKTDKYTSPKALDNLPTIRIFDIEETPVYDYWHDLVYDYSIISPVQYRIYEGGYVDGEMQEDFSGAYSSTSIHTRYFELTFKGMAKGLINDLIHRYYHDYHYEGKPMEIENSKFDQLYVANGETKLIFLSIDNKVIYIKYSGNTDLDKIISLLEEKYDL